MLKKLSSSAFLPLLFCLASSCILIQACSSHSPERTPQGITIPAARPVSPFRIWFESTGPWNGGMARTLIEKQLYQDVNGRYFISDSIILPTTSQDSIQIEAALPLGETQGFSIQAGAVKRGTLAPRHRLWVSDLHVVRGRTWSTFNFNLGSLSDILTEDSDDQYQVCLKVRDLKSGRIIATIDFILGTPPYVSVVR